MIDQFIVAAYFILIFSISFYSRSKIQSFTNTNSLGKDLSSSRILFATTIFVTSVGGGTSLGLPETVYIGALYYPLALIVAILADILVAIYLVPRMQRKHFRGVGDMLSMYYGNVGRLIGGLSNICTSISYMTVQICCSAYIMQFFLGLTYEVGLAISYVAVLMYTITGGIRSIFINHFFQFLAIIFSIPIITVVAGISLSKSGELHQVMDLYSCTTNNFNINFVLAIISFSLMGINPPLIQRITLSEDSKTIRQAIYLKSFFYFLLIIAITINGLFAKILFPNISPWQAMPYMVEYIIPIGLKSIVIIGFLATVISTADADLNIASSACINDILVLFDTHENNKVLLILSRTFTILLSIISLFLSFYFDNIIDLAIFASSFWVPIVIVPLIASLWGVRTDHTYFVLSAIAGFVAFISWQIFFTEQYSINSLIIGFLASFTVFCMGILHKYRSIIVSP